MNPRKGIDNHYKQELGEILRTLARHGVTILLTFHDVESCAQYAVNWIGLFFQGNLVSCKDARSFFAGNNFYTTAANRMARAWFPDAVTVSDVIEAVGSWKRGEG